MIFIITGMAATGKDTVVKYLETLRSEEGKPIVYRIKNVTTRPMRPTETGDEYDFITDEEFNKRRTTLSCVREFVTEQGCWKYGLDIKEMDNDKTYICIADPRGAVELTQKMLGQCVIINLMAKTELRRERYLGRTNRTPEDFEEWARREEADKVEHIMSGFASSDVDYAIEIKKEDSVETIANAIIQVMLTEELYHIKEE